MNTTCERCGSLLRPGRSPAQCEHCRDRTSHTASSDDSGLIDIRAMTKMFGDAGVRPITPVPAFGLTAAAPGLANQPAPRRPTTVPKPSQTPLHVLLGVLVFGVVGLAGAVVHSATRTADAAPTLQAADATPAEPTPAAVADDEAGKVPTKSAAPEPGEDDTEDEAETAEQPASKPVNGPRKPARPAARADKPAPKPVPLATPNPPTTVDDRGSVACLLTPGKCAPKREAPPTTSPPPAPTADADLPARLELSDINDGTRAAKASAISRCDSLAKGGEIVKIKLSIAGPTGAVVGTSSESDDGNPSLATCCANELKAAQFKPVQKAQIGAVVTLKF